MDITRRTVLGGAFSAGSASVFNCVYDRDIDEQMRRTRRRALPRHIVSPAAALTFGFALGILSTLQVGVPNGVSNGVGDVGLEVAYAIAHGVTGLQLVNGTEAFNPSQLPLGI